VQSVILYKFSLIFPVIPIWPSGSVPCLVLNLWKTSIYHTSQPVLPSSGAAGTFHYQPGSKNICTSRSVAIAKAKFAPILIFGLFFLATGIWHGAAWNFIAWGLFHGFFIFVERLGFKAKVLDKIKPLGHILTLLIVIVGWVLFRADGLKNALSYLKVMFLGQSPTVPLQLYTVPWHRTIITLIIAILLSGIIQIIFGKLKRTKRIQIKYVSYLQPIVLTVLFLLCIMSIISNTYSSFIYFRF